MIANEILIAALPSYLTLGQQLRLQRSAKVNNLNVQVTGIVLVELSSPPTTALSGPISRLKHMGYMLINIAHVHVKWFQHVFPSFRIIVKKKT